MKDWKEIQKRLAAPFAADEIEWKPQAANEKKTRALAVAYINARAVMDRLDEVVGAGEWSDAYRVLPNGKNVECTLTVKGVSKSDVGEPNQGGFSDPHKSAYSDALKRAAVKFGIGRYLYNLPTQWVGCKPQGKSVVLTETPVLPAWATPDGEGKPPKRANGDSRGTASPQAQAKRKRPKKKGKPFYATVAKQIPYYKAPDHAKNTMEKLGIEYPQTGQDATAALALLNQYADLRADGVEQDEAKAIVIGEMGQADDAEAENEAA